MPEQKIIYDQETGEELKRPAITAREAVQREPLLYGWKRPTPKQQAEAAKVRKSLTAEPAAAVDDPAEPAETEPPAKSKAKKPAKSKAKKPAKSKAAGQSAAPESASESG